MPNGNSKVTLQSISINPDSVVVTSEKIQQIEKFLLENKNVIESLTDNTIKNMSKIQKQAALYLKSLSDGFIALQNIFLKKNFTRQTFLNFLVAREKKAQEGFAQQFAKMEQEFDLALIELQQYIRNIALYTEVFSSSCQEMLGYKTSILYIPDQDDPIIYEVKNLEELLEKGHLTKAKIYKSKKDMEILSKNINNDVKKINNSKKLGIQQASYLDTAYSKIINRYNTYKYTSSTLKRPISIVMWNMDTGTPSRKWMAMKLTNKGDLAETYASIVFHRKAIFSGIQSPEQDIDTFMWGVTEVDSVSGLLEGDFLIGNKSFSVKSGQASTQGIVIAMELAKQILEQTSATSIKKLLQDKKTSYAYNKEGNRKGLRNFVRSIGTKSLQQVYGTGLKRVNK